MATRASLDLYSVNPVAWWTCKLQPLLASCKLQQAVHFCGLVYNSGQKFVKKHKRTQTCCWDLLLSFSQANKYARFFWTRSFRSLIESIAQVYLFPSQRTTSRITSMFHHDFEHQQSFHGERWVSGHSKDVVHLTGQGVLESRFLLKRR